MELNFRFCTLSTLRSVRMVYNHFESKYKKNDSSCKQSAWCRVNALWLCVGHGASRELKKAADREKWVKLCERFPMLQIKKTLKNMIIINNNKNDCKENGADNIDDDNKIHTYYNIIIIT